MTLNAEAARKLRGWSGMGLIALRKATEIREEHNCTILEAMGVVHASGHTIAMKADTPERRQEMRTARDLQIGKEYAEQWRQEDPAAVDLENEVEALLGQEPQSSKPR